MSRRRWGFSLLECLLTLAIIGLLLGWTLPRYRAYLARMHRVEAERVLLQLAMDEERYRAAQQRYADWGELGRMAADDGFYRYAIEGLAQDGFTATATPLGAQVSDACARLSIDAQGERRSSAVPAPENCW